MNRFVVLAVAAAVSGASGSAARASEPAGPGTAIPAPRLAHEEYEALVAGPLRRLEADDVDGAVREFEALLARQRARNGERSAAVADHLMAFGLALFEHWAETKLRGLAYFRRAIPAYRAAFGADHPELALALITYADAAMIVQPDDPPDHVEAALEEAHRIRAAYASSTDPLALSALVQLARVRGLPSRTGGDRSRVEAVAALFRQAVDAFADQLTDARQHNRYSPFYEMAAMYVRNGMVEEGLAAALEAHADYRHSYAGNDELCRALAVQAFHFHQFLIERGRAAEADELRRRSIAASNCFGIMFQPLELPEPQPAR